MAVVSAAVNREPVELAPEAVHSDVTWVSSYEVDPFEVPMRDKAALLADWSGALLRDPGVDHVQASLMQVKEQKFYADTAGTSTTQQRVRVHPQLKATRVLDGRFDSMRTLAPPVGRGTSTSPAPAGTSPRSWRASPSCWRRSFGRPLSRRGRTTW